MKRGLWPGRSRVRFPKTALGRRQPACRPNPQFGLSWFGMVEWGASPSHADGPRVRTSLRTRRRCAGCQVHRAGSPGRPLVRARRMSDLSACELAGKSAGVYHPVRTQYGLCRRNRPETRSRESMWQASQGGSPGLRPPQRNSSQPSRVAGVSEDRFPPVRLRFPSCPPLRGV